MSYVMALLRVLNLVGLLVNLWQRQQAKQEGRDEVLEAQRKADDAASNTAKEVRGDVARLPDDDLDARLRKYQRD